MTKLDLRTLRAMSSASPTMLAFYAETASVMLWRFHAPHKSLELAETPGTWHRGEQSIPVILLWNEPTMEVLHSHGNEQDATEQGAYALAIAVADALGFHVLGRAHHGSGSDWIMIPRGEPTNDYYKLEVSGMARAGTESPASRLAAKVQQGSNGDLRRPGVAVVARFQDAAIFSEQWS
jgi:hypothetical protein